MSMVKAWGVFSISLFIIIFIHCFCHLSFWVIYHFQGMGFGLGNGLFHDYNDNTGFLLLHFFLSSLPLTNSDAVIGG